MARPEQAPTIEDGDGIHSDYVVKHPAFAQIGASRVSGSARLYGSDFAHQHYMTIRIYPSEQQRGLSNDRYRARVTPYIEVALSEAQWATFVSAPNIGFGVPCTLQYKDGEQIPGIAPAAEVPHEKFEVEARQKMERALGELDLLAREIDELKLSQKQKDALKSRAAMARQQLVSNVPFVLKQFGEHMESTVEKAKIEVNAYVTGAVMRAGLKALGAENGEAPILQLQSAAKRNQ
jgi:hypothetical protein